VQLEGLDRDDVEEGLRKLGGLTEAPERDVPLGAVPTPPVLLDLFVAVLERRQVRFTYGGEERDVQPHRLQFERGRWYLTGLDLGRDDRRSFRLDRMDGEVTSGAARAFEPPQDVHGVRLRPWELGPGEPVTAQVLLDADIARSVLNEDPGLRVAERHDDGAVVIELSVRNPDALRSFVLTLLDRAELLGPADLRADMVAHLRELAEDHAA
jgi:proteasome accessory factor B